MSKEADFGVAAPGHSTATSNTELSPLDWDDPCSAASSSTFPLYQSYYLQQNNFLHPSKTASSVSASSLTRSPYAVLRTKDKNAEDADVEAGDKNPTALHVATQLCLWFMLFFAIFVILFSLVTAPSSPAVAVKDIELKVWRMAQGSDRSGVPTKVVTCDLQVKMQVRNPSQYFGVHLQPPRMSLFYSQLLLATARGEHVYVQRESEAVVEMGVGSRRKAVYGAGPAIAHSLFGERWNEGGGSGLPLRIDIHLKSNIRVVWNIVKPTFRHHVVCLVDVDGSHGPRHLRISNSSCIYRGKTA